MFRYSERFETAGVAAAVAAVMGGFLVIEPAAAQSDSGLEVDVAECVEIESPAERFRCYESRVDSALREQGGEAGSAAGDASGRAAPASPPSPASPSAARAESSRAAPSRGEAASRAAARAAVPEIDASESPSVDDFGLRAPREEADDAKQQEELYGTIAALRETVPNSYLITLENGQVWRQMRPEFYPLREGHRVRIYSTRWGSSYRLTVEELKGFIQVERVR